MLTAPDSSETAIEWRTRIIALYREHVRYHELDPWYPGALSHTSPDSDIVEAARACQEWVDEQAERGKTGGYGIEAIAREISGDDEGTEADGEAWMYASQIAEKPYAQDESGDYASYLPDDVTEAGRERVHEDAPMH